MKIFEQMPVDFLSILDETNSTKDDKTGEIILTAPTFSTTEDYEITKPCRITSNCGTIIKSQHFEIKSNSVSFTNINFRTSVHVVNSDNFQIMSCTSKEAKLLDGAFCFFNCKNVYLNDVTITETNNITGIYITQDCTVTAENLNIYGLSETLLVCNTLSCLYLKNSQLHHTKANAIFISGGSYIEIRKCSLFDTVYPAIYVSQSKCRIEDNEIKTVSQNGISLNTVKSFIVSRNNITDVNGSAIAVLDSSDGVAYRNNISKVGGNGIYVCNNSKIKAYKNEITDNHFPGIAILMHSDGSLIKNKISKIVYSGICVRGANEVKIVKSSIEKVQECGISISDTKKCIVIKNSIVNCKIAAIEVYNRSRTYVCENEISDIGEYTFLAYTSAFMIAKKNVIKNIGKSMVKLIYKGGGIFINNIISNCPSQKDGQTSSSYFLSGNGEYKSVTNDKSKANDSVLLEDPYVETSSFLCIKCQKKPRDCFLLECGHKVYCKECAEQALKNKEMCPLCRFPIENVTTGFTAGNDDVCVICLDKPANCIIVPCGHVGFCKHCLDHWYKTNKKCPICRYEPSFFKKIIDDI